MGTSGDRFSISPVTISQCSFEAAFRVAGDAGFQGIGMRYNQLEAFLEHGGDVKHVRSLARRHGLELTEMAFLAEWQFHGGVPIICVRQRTGVPAEAPEAARERLRVFLERCEQLECPNVTAVPAIGQAGCIAHAAADFAALCDAARPYGGRMCLEFMGPAVQVRDVRTGWELVELANRPNGGLLIDTFLFHQGESSLDDIDVVPAEKVFSVHVADAKPKPKAELNMLEDRLFPGEGAVGMVSLIARLLRHGYAGWWTVELFNPNYAKADPLAVAKKARETTEAVVRHARRAG